MLVLDGRGLGAGLDRGCAYRGVSGDSPITSRVLWSISDHHTSAPSGSENRKYRGRVDGAC